ncbi:MAG: NHLP bacteriocin system secretion protein [Zavarzinia sp.]|nr:NHLP bacteriocin system secretion protein [Zavarzinia sp.]
MSDESLFRAQALDSLGREDALDEPLRLVPLRLGLAAFGLMAALAALIAAAFVVEVPVTVEARGLVLYEGRASDLAATVGGRLLDVGIAPGDTVTAEQIVATFDQTTIRQQRIVAAATLADRERQRRELRAISEQAATTEQESADEALSALDRREASLREKLAFLEKVRRADEALQAKGFATDRQVFATTAGILDTRDQLAQILAERGRIRFDLQRSRAAREREVLNLDLAVADAAREVEALDRRIELERVLRSPVAGRVVELKAGPGDVLAPGAPLATLVPTGADLRVTAFAAATEGKKIPPGATVRLYPASEDGQRDHVLGTVVAVSELPASREGLFRLLANEDLVRSMAGEDNPFMIDIALARDPGQPDGFVWSGPAARRALTAGTVLRAEVVTEYRSLAAIVIPALDDSGPAR